MIKVIKKNKGTITLAGITAIATLILILLTIVEKAEKVFSEPSSIENYSEAKFTDKPEYFQEQASKK